MLVDDGSHFIGSLTGLLCIRVVTVNLGKLSEGITCSAPCDTKPNADALAAKSRGVHAVVPISAPYSYKSVMSAEVIEKIYGTVEMLVNSTRSAVVIRNLNVKYILSSKLLYY